MKAEAAKTLERRAREIDLNNKKCYYCGGNAGKEMRPEGGIIFS